MSFFKSIKRVFGFGDDVEADVYDSETLDIPDPANLEVPDSIANLEIDSQHAELIFQHVVTIFNQALPTFLADSVDADKQHRILYDTLDKSLKDYLSNLQQLAMQQCQADWMAERDKLQANAEELKKHAEDLEEKRSSLKERQLSAERQKRALSERVRDLEAQVLRLESEKEQLDIENKCMLNKAKAAAVLEEELEELRKNSEPVNATRNEINDAMLSDFKRQAAEATQKLKEQEEKIANIDQTLSLKDAQIDDLKQVIAQKEAALVQAQDDIASRDTIIAEKDEAISEKEAELAEKDEALNNSISPEELEAIQNQISQFEEVRLKMDSHITKLREALHKAQEENRTLNDALKQSLKEKTQEKVSEDTPDIVSEPTTKYEPMHQLEPISQSETKLQNTSLPESLSQPEPQQKTLPKAKEESAPKKENKPREESRPKSKRDYINDLDDVDAIISGSNWMVSMPDEESPMASKADKGTFGYQAPQRKRIPDNDPQPSLFDF